jgi:hypothetical protein
MKAGCLYRRIGCDSVTQESGFTCAEAGDAEKVPAGHNWQADEPASREKGWFARCVIVYLPMSLFQRVFAA